VPGHDDAMPDFADFRRLHAFRFVYRDRVRGRRSIGDGRSALPAALVRQLFSRHWDHRFWGAGSTAEGFGANAHPVTVISYQMWKERFHGDSEYRQDEMLTDAHTIVAWRRKGFMGLRGLGDASSGSHVDAGEIRSRRVQLEDAARVGLKVSPD